MPNKTKTPEPKQCYRYNQENMMKAVQAVKENIMSTRCAAKTFSVPHTSLQRRIEGQYNVNSHSGRKPVMSYADEKKLIDYSCNRASMGIGFGKKQFLKYAAILGKKKNLTGVLISHSNFCGLLKKAWEKAMSPANIISGFRACGILPFDPNAIPNEAYLTNIPHHATVIEAVEIAKENMTCGLSNGRESIPTQVITDMNSKIKDSQVETILEKIGSNKSYMPIILPFKEIDIKVNNNNNIIADHSLMPDSCNAILGLHALELSVSPECLAIYKKMYKEGRAMINDRIYNTWKRYKDMTVPSTIISIDQILPEDPNNTLAMTDLTDYEQENLEPVKISNSNSKLLPNIIPSPHQEHSNFTNQNNILQSTITSNTQTINTNIPVSSFYRMHKNNCFSNIADEDTDILRYPTTNKTSKKMCRTGNYFVLTSNEVFESKQRAMREKQAKIALKEERKRLRESKKFERAEIEKTKQQKRGKNQKNKKNKN